MRSKFRNFKEESAIETADQKTRMAGTKRDDLFRKQRKA